MTDRYAQRGVSADKEDVHNAIARLDKGLFPKAFCKIVPDALAVDKKVVHHLFRRVGFRIRRSRRGQIGNCRVERLSGGFRV